MRVFVTGVARSGTTWVARALAAAPGQVYIHEPDNFEMGPLAGAMRRRVGLHPLLEPGQDAPVYEHVWEMAFAGSWPRVPSRGPLVVELGRVAAAGPGWLASPVRRRALESAAATPGSVVVKSIHAALAAEWIAERYRPAVVVVKRSLLTVISSWIELGLPTYDLDARADIRMGLVEPLGLPEPPDARAPLLDRVTWEVGVLATGLYRAADRHPDWHVLSHDLTCLQPKAAFAALYQELGLEWGPAPEAFLDGSNRPGSGFGTNRVAAEQPQRWLERLTPDEVRRVTERLAEFPLDGEVTFASTSAVTID